MYAMRRPSGDQVGQVSCTVGVVVNRVGSVPSASITQMSQLESSLMPHREYAICVPAAFQSGRPSLRVAVSVRRAVPVSGARTTHRSLWFAVKRLNTMSPFSPGNEPCAAVPPTPIARNAATTEPPIARRFTRSTLHRSLLGIDLGSGLDRAVCLDDDALTDDGHVLVVEFVGATSHAGTGFDLDLAVQDRPADA